MAKHTAETGSKQRAVAPAAPSNRQSLRVGFRSQVIGMALLIVIGVLGFARWRTGSVSLVWPYMQGQRLLFSETRVELGNVKTEVIERRILVRNLSSNPLTLLGSQMSCKCISTDQFPIVIPSGGSLDLGLRIGTASESGPFVHTIKFFSDELGYTPVIVKVLGTVSGP